MKTTTEHPTATGTVLSAVAVVLSANLLSGCSSGYTPTYSERQFMIADKPVHLSSLSCGADGRFVASGFIRNSLSVDMGVALYSSDHGANWRVATFEPLPTETMLTHIAVPGAKQSQTPFLAGYHFAKYSPPGPWWKSNDLGASWYGTTAPLSVAPVSFWWQPLVITQVSSDPPVFAYLALAPESSKLNPRTVLIRSTDNGKTWHQHGLPVPLQWPFLATDGKGHVILSGSTPVEFFNPPAYPIYWSADAGSTWARVGESYSKMAYFFTAVGNVITYNTTERKYGRTLVGYSLDNGRNFTLSNDPDLSSSGVIEAIASDQQGRVIAITEMDYVLVSDDGGESWRIVNDTRFSRRHFFPPKLVFFENGIAVALMPGGAIIRSTDRGDSWNKVQSPLPEGSYDFLVLCTDDSGVIFASGQGMAIRSVDHGQTWQPVQLK